MSCHTWCYTKLEKPNLSKIELIDFLKNQLIHSINYLKNILKNEKNKQDRKETKDEINHYIQLINNLDNLDLKQLYSLYFEQLNYLFVEFNNEYYIETEYHDLFRHFNYESKSLTSLEETLEFIKKDCYGYSFKNDNGQFNSDPINIELIKEFWSKYPNGLIEFG